MKLYSGNDEYKLYHGNMLDMLEVIEPNSIDSIVTDPPYGLTSITKPFGKEGSAPASTKNNDGSFARLSRGFMGKEWDGSGIEYNIDTWKKCYEVLKPGGYLLAFGGSRTSHRIACAIEDAGFEIRDTIMWLYGSGFPKSMNIGLAIDKKNGVESKVVGYADTTMPDFRDVGKKQKEISGIDKLTFGQIENSERKETPIYKAQNEWQGWGTALKPSFEPIIVARKPFKGSLVDNVIENGVGGINIDECRVPFEKTKNPATNPLYRKNGGYKLPAKGQSSNGAVSFSSSKNDVNEIGRFPANTILTYDETNFDEVCNGFPNSKGASSQNNYSNGSIYRGQSLNESTTKLNGFREWYNDSGSASRYFYCAKASKKDRDEGCQELEDTVNACSNQAIAELKRGNDTFSDEINSTFNKVYKGKNTHPTVKPTTLMQYLVRLVTPNGGTVLDPFNGSGSTGKAVMYENKERDKGYKYIGIELTDEYLPISKARIEYVCNLKEEQPKEKQLELFEGELR